jgi:hypothetical protein
MPWKSGTVPRSRDVVISLQRGELLKKIKLLYREEVPFIATCMELVSERVVYVDTT